MNNENVLLIAPNPNAFAPTPDEVAGVIGGADGPTAIITAETVGVAENMASAWEILGQGMASIFVVLGIIAVFVSLLKKLDNKKK